VLCARCTRFSEQISGDPFIELFERGALEQVAIYEDEPYESYFSGNVIQICPVGALTSTVYRFKARPFDVVTTPSVCDHCSAGCTLTVQSRRGEIQRQLARTNMAVNEAWNCDKGRFGFTHLTAPRASPRRSCATGRRARSRRAGPRRCAPSRGDHSRREPARACRRADRLPAGRRGRLRWSPSTPAPCSAPTTSTTAPASRRPESATSCRAGRPRHRHLRRRRGRPGHRGRRARPRGGGPDPPPAPAQGVAQAHRPHRGRRPAPGHARRLAWRRVPTAPGGRPRRCALLAARSATTRPSGRPTDARDAEPSTPVVLVGERAGAGSLTAAGRLADGVRRQGRLRPASGRRPRGDRGRARRRGCCPVAAGSTTPDDRAAVEAVWGALPDRARRDLHAILTDAAAGEDRRAAPDRGRPRPRRGLDRAGQGAGQGRPRWSCQDLAATDTVAAFADVVLPGRGPPGARRLLHQLGGPHPALRPRDRRSRPGPGRLGDRRPARGAARPRPRLQRPRRHPRRDGAARRRDGQPTTGPRCPRATSAGTAPEGDAREGFARSSRGRCCSTAARCSPAPPTCSPPRGSPSWSLVNPADAERSASPTATGRARGDGATLELLPVRIATTSSPGGGGADELDRGAGRGARRRRAGDADAERRRGPADAEVRSRDGVHPAVGPAAPGGRVFAYFLLTPPC
jgi:hypothetical protein